MKDDDLSHFIDSSWECATNLIVIINDVDQDRLIRDVDEALRTQRRIGRMLEKVKKELRRRRKK